MIITRTPFRVSLFGGGTDFPEFYRVHGGAVLSAAIDQYCYLSLHRLAPYFPHRFRASYSRTESVQSPADFQHPLVRECLLHLDFTDSVEISHVADLPGRSGLASSSAFTVGLLHALAAFRGDSPTPDWLAENAIEVERNRVCDAGGRQDQYAVAFGGFNRIAFDPSGTVAVRPVRASADTLAALQDSLLLFFLNADASAQDILRAQISRTADNTPDLLQILSLVDTAESLLARNDLSSFGALLHETWLRKRRLAPGISTTLIDDAYAAARSAGALGGKLLGAGGRGFLCLFVPPDRRASVLSRLSNLRPVPFRFSPTGSSLIFSSP
ncbi:MAG: kinase [Kiritimatiellae bacterium]|nr:kinase [Kiritimatiellia bacterium]